MEYRDFFKNKKATAKDIERLIPEGVDPDEFKKGINTEKEHTDDEFISAKIAGDHLREDPKYYSKLSDAGLEEEDVEEHCGACEDDMGNEYDDNGGLPKVGGALAVPHRGQPIMMGKIIQVGKGFGQGSATGELSGMTKAGGVTKDQGGVPVKQDGDKEPLTAGGKKTDSSVASKSVGGAVVPGEGQKQGGLNSKGTIANTPRLDEGKTKVRKIVKEVLKEIRFDNKSGKWVRLNEGGHKAGCKCAFCANKGKFGKKSKEEVDENTVDMKMGPSYKTVQPRLYKTSEDDFARTNQYDPEITEMYDDEEECTMNERYVELANAQRNLTEAELCELKTLREKIDKISEEKFLKKAINPAHKGYCTPMSKPTCTPHRKAFARRAKAGEFSGDESIEEVAPPGWEGTVKAMKKHSVGGAKKWNPKKKEDEGVEEAEKKKITNPYALAWWMKGKGYKSHKEDEGVDETVDMKMGSSYKKVSPTQARCSDCDHARTIQYDPEVTEEIDEAGGQAVQHSSYRTVGHGNLPQSGKQRWSDDLDEGSKPSKVAKTIQKGMKAKKTQKNPHLKFQPTKKTSSGVHKRKP
jgi:hypothetical protein